MNMIEDPSVALSVSRILQRSERQDDFAKIVDSFVDTGIIEQVDNSNNQIIYGRRGTGKTHVLKYLEQKVLDTPNAITLYIDCRSLGSSSQFTDPDKPMAIRCLSLFKDLLQLLNQRFLEELTSNVQDQDVVNKGLDYLSQLQNAVIEPKKEFVEMTMESTADQQMSRGAKFTMEPSKIGIELEGKNSRSAKVDRTYSVTTENKVFFPEITTIIKDFLNHLDKSCLLLIDEWASLPFDIQPYLAELLKRGIIPISRITVKIASLEYRSNFYVHTENTSTGLEIGSDIAANIDIDDYYVYDKNPKEISSFFAEVLHKHMEIDLEKDYLSQKFSVGDGRSLVAALFYSDEIFSELVRASEGVIRDLINVFTKAFFETKKQKSAKVDKNVITSVAQQWYEQDKERNLTDELKEILGRIIRDVIGEKKARSFLVPRNLESNRYIQQLFDFRILHVIKRGYADKDNPGERYNIYTLDYGTYVDLLKTKNKPVEEFLFTDLDEKEDVALIVPFDDKRSIRRIILRDNVLLVGSGK